MKQNIGFVAHININLLPTIKELASKLNAYITSIEKKNTK